MESSVPYKMKFLIAVTFLACLACASAFGGLSLNQVLFELNNPVADEPARFARQFVNQWRDNFNESDLNIFENRFIENSEHFEPGGPIILWVNADRAINDASISDGKLIVDVAEELGGVIFSLEPRFYAKSRPTLTTATNGLRFLNIEQMLADLAVFVRTLKRDRPELANAKVFAAGVRHGAALAVWFRQRYPDDVQGVWASSPVLHAKMNLFEYQEEVGRIFRDVGGQACYNFIERAYEEMEELVRQGNSERLSKEINLCSELDLSRSMDVWGVFTELLIDMGIVIERSGPKEIVEHCNFLMDPKFNNAAEAYGAWVVSHTPVECFEYEYNKWILLLRQIVWAFFTNDWLRQFVYQECTEYGWFLTTEGGNHPFGTFVTVDGDYKMCKDIFGSSYTEEFIDAGMAKTNLFYGSFYPTASNVYYTFGSLDPWISMGPKGQLPQGASMNVIPLLHHAADLDSISPEDSPDLVISKQTVISLAKNWTS